MAPLFNYLRTNRKRLSLSQEEVGFLLGLNAGSKESKVSRDEHFAREPGLRTALAYEAIYCRPVSELFAGLYEQVEQEVSSRARILVLRKDRTPDPRRREAIANLVSKANA